MKYYYHKQTTKIFEHVLSIDNNCKFNNTETCYKSVFLCAIVEDDSTKTFRNEDVCYFPDHKEITKKEFEEWIFINNI